MRHVTVVYHYEDGCWWGDSPDQGLETFVAGGESLEETRQMAREGAEFHLGEEVALTELFDDPRHAVTYLEFDAPALVVTVSGGPERPLSPSAKVSVVPVQPRLVPC